MSADQGTIRIRPTVSIASTDPLNGATGTVQSLSGPNGPVVTLSAVKVPALPVHSSSPPAPLGGVQTHGQCGLFVHLTGVDTTRP